MIRLKRPLDLDLSDSKITEFLGNLQGNILKGHGRKYTAHFLVRFKPRFKKTARAWLAFFAENKVTSALHQMEQKELHLKGQEELFAIVLLSAAGYRALRINDLEIPDEGKGIFKSGMQVSFPNIEEDLQTWEDPYQSEIHAMILLAHENSKALEKEVRTIAMQLHRFCDLIHLEEGEKLTDENGQVIENFGYADGISNPVFIKQDIEKELQEMGGENWKPGASLDTVLFAEPQSNTYGSFMVFRKLEQDPANFESQVNALALKLNIDAKEAGARIMGRYPNGKPLIHKPEMAAVSIQNDFNYETDTEGMACPFSAHIRKTNPRRERNEKDIRIVRRGITYGERRVWLYGATPATESKVGLLFMSFQSDLESFEALQKRADNINFVQDGVGVDALIGRPGNGYVTSRGGEYFFAPSIPTLKRLEDLRDANLELSSTQKDRIRQGIRELGTQKAVLRKIGHHLSKGDMIAAVEELGIQASDFDALYAYLIPHLAELYSQDSNNPIMAQTNSPISELSPQLVQPYENAFLNLLDPVQLDQFSQLWVNDKDKALRFVGLRGGEQDTQLLYNYLAQFNIRLSLFIWI
jgi:Dyp-type peroxidase family